MTSLPYQPVPTAAQQRELERLLASDRAKRYAVRQYRDVQAVSSDVSAAGVACCDVAANEPDDDGMGWASLIAACLAGMGMWAAVGYATWWVVGLIFGAHA